MARRCEEPVDVRERAGQAGCDHESGPAPDAFVWRGRLYVVRTVIGHWLERRTWLLAQTGPRADADQGAWVGTATDVRHEVWRVEASPGRLLGTGTYDLARDGAGSQGAAGGWLLLRVAE